MAKLYGEIPSSALMTFDKSFARANGQPLDSTEVYYSLAAAQEYAATAGAYIGQKIVVIENNIITHYSIEDAAGTLKELGAKPIGDNKSIEINGSTIAIKDFGKAYYKYIPETETEAAHYVKVTVGEKISEDGEEVYAWKAGLEPKVALEGENLVLGWYEPNPTTIEGLSGALEALDSRVDATEGNITGIIDEIADIITTIGSAEEGEEPATGLIAEIAKKADTTYVDAEIGALEDAISKLNHFTTKIVESTDDVTESGVLYLIKDESVAGVDKYNEYLYIEEQGAVLIGDTTTDLSDYAKSADVVSNTVFEAFKATNTEAINAKTTMAEVEAKGYAVASEVESVFAKIADVYSKEEANAAIATAIGTPGSPAVKDEDGNTTTEAVPGTGVYQHTYSKDEITSLIADITGGESAADVLASLNAYKTTNDTRVKNIEDEQLIQNADILAAKQQADLGVANAATAQGAANKAQSDVDALTLVVNGNSTNITSQGERITALETKTSDYDTVKANASDAVNRVAAVETTVGAHGATIEAHTKSINDLIAADTTLSGGIATNAGAIATLESTKANASDVYTKAQIGTLAKDAEGNDKTIVQMIADAQTAATYDDSAVKADIKANADAITLLVSGKEGDDTKSIRAIAADEVNTLIGGVSDADTIEGITSLIEYVNTNGATTLQMQTDIKANADAIAVLVDDADTEGSVAHSIATAIASIPNGSADVAGLVKVDNSTIVAKEGTISVGTITTDQLEMGELELYLNGGSASTSIKE